MVLTLGLRLQPCTLQPCTLPCNLTPYLATLHPTLQPYTLPCNLALYLATLHPTLQPYTLPCNLAGIELMLIDCPCVPNALGHEPGQRARQSIITLMTSLPLFQNGAKSGFEMCFGCWYRTCRAPTVPTKIRLEFRIKKFKPYVIHDWLRPCKSRLGPRRSTQATASSSSSNRKYYTCGSAVTIVYLLKIR